jgi:hypothetical protein
MPGQPNAPHAQGQPSASGQPHAQGQPSATGQPHAPGQPSATGQPHAHGQPHVHQPAIAREPGSPAPSVPVTGPQPTAAAQPQPSDENRGNFKPAESPPTEVDGNR